MKILVFFNPAESYTVCKYLEEGTFVAAHSYTMGEEIVEVSFPIN